MKLIVVSPEHDDPREIKVLHQLIEAGLTHYHLRKPTWDRRCLAVWLGAVSSEHHKHIVLHSHHDLARDFAVGGLHARDVAKDSLQVPIASKSGPDILRSRSVHELASFRSALQCYDRVVFSPVFSSISKSGYVPQVAHADVKSVLEFPRIAEAFALGGVNAARVAVCRGLGFDGVAVLGAVWQAGDPTSAFRELQESTANA